MGKKQILQKLEKNRDRILKYGVRRLGLFGSYARDEGKEDSDLDFVVEFEEKSFDSYMDLKLFLEELFDHKVDLVLTDVIKERLKSIIMKETVYAKGL